MTHGRASWVAGAALVAALAPACAPADVVASASLTLFETRRPDGHVPLRVDRTDMPLALEPDDPSVAIGTGASLVAPDGHPVTLGELSAATGTLRARCDGDRTDLTIDAEGLIPNGVYTVWLLGTTVPLEYDAERLPTFFAQRDLLDPRWTIFFEPAGTLDGAASVVIAGADGRLGYHDQHAPTETASSDCLLTSIPNWFVVLDYHADGRTYGPSAHPHGAEAASHLLFAFHRDQPLVIDPP